MSHIRNSDVGLDLTNSTFSSLTQSESLGSTLVDLSRIVSHYNPSGHIAVAPTGLTHGPAASLGLNEAHAVSCTYQHFSDPTATTVCKV